jgi:hypothetical protein
MSTPPHLPPKDLRSTETLEVLCCNQWLLLSGHGLELLLRRSGEIFALVSGDVLLLDGSGLGLGDGRRDGATAATDHLLSLGSIVSGELLCALGGSCGVVAGQLLDLLRLCVDQIGGILEVVVDELLIRLVDERGEEEDGGGDKCETPEWDNLDQIVGQECSDEGLELN